MHRNSRLRDWRQGWRAAVRTGAIVAAVLLLFVPMTGAAQKNKKEAKEAQDAAIVSALIPLPDGPAIELMLSQMLAAWQVGDEQMLHTFYADDVLVVSGVWEPPLQGWGNYANAYRVQRSRSQSVRMERTNTFTKVLGNTAWCTYQWEFSAQVDGTPMSAFGQTSLVLEKRAGKWLIAVNHTSAAPAPPRPVPSSAAPNPQPEARPLSVSAPGR